MIREVERAQDKIRNRRFLCRCTDCGEEKVKYLSNLTQGKGCMCGVDFSIVRAAGREVTITRRRELAQVSPEGRMCLTCGKWKPWNEFTKSSSRRPRYMGRGSNCKECAREKRLARVYGLTLDELHWLLDLQGNSCALCGEDQTLHPRSMDIDHDHSCCGTDRGCKKCIRGLLCPVCNRYLIGYVETKPLLRARFADYLDRRPFVSVAAGPAEPVLEDVVSLGDEPAA